MIDFTYQNSAKIIFGKSALSHLAEEATKYGDKVLMVYGGGSIKKIGLYDQVMQILSDAGITVWELSGIVPNPVLSRVYEGIALCREHQIGLILAVGGGSAIDTAKGVANGVCYDGDVWDFYVGKAIPKESMPLGTILTIPAAGSEMSYSSVITNEDGMMKCGFNCITNVPRFSLMNPEYAYTLPPYQTACGCVDILAHMMERYFTQVENVALTDALLEASMRTVIQQSPIVMEKPDDYDARAELMWAGSLAHNTLLQTGRIGDWGSHRLCHELSALYDLAHGAALAIIFPAWLTYVLPHGVHKVKQFATEVFGVSEEFGDDQAIALEGIARLRNFYRSLDMPICLGDAGIGTDRLSEMAERTGVSAPFGNFLSLHPKDSLAIYQLAV